MIFDKFFKNKKNIKKNDKDFIELSLKLICGNCEKNEYCASAQKDKLCYKLDVIEGLLLNKINICNVILVNESDNKK